MRVAMVLFALGDNFDAPGQRRVRVVLDMRRDMRKLRVARKHALLTLHVALDLFHQRCRFLSVANRGVRDRFGANCSRGCGRIITSLFRNREK